MFLKDIILKITHIILWIVAIILFFYGIVTSTRLKTERAFQEASKQFVIQITDKSNDSFSGYDVDIDFKFTIKNNSDKKADELSGSIKIMDMDGNVLSSGSASFRDDFTAKSEKHFILHWNMDVTEDASKLWETDFSMLSISFDLEKIKFDNNKIVEVDLEPFEKPCEKEFLEDTYNSAKSYITQKNYDKAIENLKQIVFYKDSAQLIESCETLKEKEQIASASIGSLVQFGKYEQDYDYDNGTETIQWIVLARDGNKVLLLSDYALEDIEYDHNGKNIWKTSYLRSWLNDNFFANSFTKSEQELITITNITPSEEEEEKGGVATRDYVFILSADELEGYVTDVDQRCAKVSTYLYNQDSSYRDGVAYWVRTPGPNVRYTYTTYASALVIDSDGDLITDGKVSVEPMPVRPAIWVTIED